MSLRAPVPPCEKKYVVHVSRTAEGSRLGQPQSGHTFSKWVVGKIEIGIEIEFGIDFRFADSDFGMKMNRTQV